MAKKSSKASCFKCIGCSDDHESVDKDDLQAPEVKNSSDRSKWSPWKRSARHRGLSNSVATESSSGNKAMPDAATVSFQPQINSPIPDKSEFFVTEEKTKAPKPEEELSETVDVSDANSISVNLDESVVIIIQAAIRGFLAERILLKQKNIIKLQAAVRGHIVRNHAVGSLRCVLAIVKMQAIIRGRRTRILLEKLRTDGNEGKPFQRNANENDCSFPQAYVSYTSIEKLLRKSFVRQLLESNPSAKLINFKCDPLKSDSAWIWLERWMSAASTRNDHSLKLESPIAEKKEECLEKSEYQLDNVISPGENCRFREGKLTPQESAYFSADDENIVTDEVLSPESDARGPSLSSSSDDLSKPGFNDVGTKNSFDESVVLPDQDDMSKVSSDAAYPVSDIKTMETIPAKSLLPPSSVVEVSSSERGTELSISSTLDSPDTLDVGLPNVEKETAVSEDAIDYNKNHLSTVVDAEIQSPSVENDLSGSYSVLQERHENKANTESEHDNPSANDVISSQPDKISEANETETKTIHLETDVVNHQASKQSPDSLDVTPSSHVSMKHKKNSSGKSGHNHKHNKPESSDPSGVRNSTEHLPKNHKTGRRRDSFGSARTDLGNDEPRDSSSSNSLPSYMQATESARAKAIANSSPRSSPDVLDKDFSLKKRHSLPGSITKQGSPRVQLVSKSPQSAKTLGIHSPQERKWRR